MAPKGPEPTTDPFDLSRFVSAQKETYRQALLELRKGQKESHWMWFIFPQIAGLGSSSTAKYYAIKSLNEAKAYVVHPILGPRLLECCQALLEVQGNSALAILGDPDYLKLRSSMTLFAYLADNPLTFAKVLNKYFSGLRDDRTIDLLARNSH